MYKRHPDDLTFYNVLARQGFPFCYTACWNFQVYALRDIKMAALEVSCMGQKVSYWSRRVIAN